MTATEALIRAQEGDALGPDDGASAVRCLGPQIEREIDLLMFHRILPPMPPELVEAGASTRSSTTRRCRGCSGPRSWWVQRTMELLAHSPRSTRACSTCSTAMHWPA